MAKKGRTSVLKRQRELRKAEKTALKRDKRRERPKEGAGVATRDDLEGYGLGPDSEEVEQH